MRRTLINYCLVILILLTGNRLASAQNETTNYEEQLAALKESFEKGSPEAIKAHVSEELTFGDFPASLTPTILTQIFSGQLKLKSMEVMETKEGEALVRYDIYGLGERTSRVLFDDDARIKRIELVDNIIKLQIEAQKELANQVKEPNPGEMAEKYPFVEITFKSLDGLIVTGNLYEADANAHVILLCHQAGYNKFEYADIAPRLNEMGFNALAIDQRSGGVFAGKRNSTFDQAKSMGLSTEFLDAQQDIEAAANFLYEKYDQKVIAWGSSYSSSLVLHVAAKSDKIMGTISFSPGDYFGEERPSLASVFSELEKPFLVTSSKRESVELSRLLEGVNLGQNQQQFIPEGNGYHGSRALWEGQKGGEEYWNVLKLFLMSLKNQ